MTTALDPNGSKKVSAFLMKYHAKGGQWNCCGAPMPTVVTKESIGLVTVSGTDYDIAELACGCSRHASASLRRCRA